MCHYKTTGAGLPTQARTVLMTNSKSNYKLAPMPRPCHGGANTVFAVVLNANRKRNYKLVLTYDHGSAPSHHGDAGAVLAPANETSQPFYTTPVAKPAIKAQCIKLNKIYFFRKKKAKFFCF